MTFLPNRLTNVGPADEVVCPLHPLCFCWQSYDDFVATVLLLTILWWFCGHCATSLLRKWPTPGVSRWSKIEWPKNVSVGFLVTLRHNDYIFVISSCWRSLNRCLQILKNEPWIFSQWNVLNNLSTLISPSRKLLSPGIFFNFVAVFFYFLRFLFAFFLKLINRKVNKLLSDFCLKFALLNFKNWLDWAVTSLNTRPNSHPCSRGVTPLRQM